MFSALFALAASAEAMPATGKWVVDYAEAHCTAQRSFGRGRNPWVLVIKPSPTSDVVQLLLVSDGGPQGAVQDEARLSLGKAPPIKVNQLRYSAKNNGVRLINLTAEHARLLGEADTVEWVGAGADKRLALGPMKALMATLAACREDLRNHWNITPEKQQAMIKPAAPRKPLRGYFSPDDYPLQAVRSSESGLTSVVLLIDEQGAIKDCMIDGTSSIATLDAMTCIVFRERAKFDPAIGKDGTPVRSHHIQRIRWEMP